MANKKLDERNASETLFINNWSATRIHEALGISKNTLTKWAEEGNWHDKRDAQNNFKANVTDDLRIIVQNQAKVLRLMSQKLMEGVTEEMEYAELQKQLITAKDADAFYKIYANIKNSYTSWDELVQVLNDFTKFLERQENEMAKKVMPFINEFINMKRNSV